MASGMHDWDGSRVRDIKCGQHPLEYSPLLKGSHSCIQPTVYVYTWTSLDERLQAANCAKELNSLDLGEGSNKA